MIRRIIHWRSLNLIQNASAGVLTGIRKRDHIAPILASFQWLPIKSRIDLKILLLTFKVLRGQAPLYLEKLIAPDHPNRPLSSESAGLLELLRVFQSGMAVWAFCSQAPLMWDLLPVKVQQVPLWFYDQTENLALWESLQSEIASARSLFLLG